MVRCIQLPSTANGATNYVFGLMGTGAGAQCTIGGFSTDGACTYAASADFVLVNVAASSGWTATRQVVTPSAGTNSFLVNCASAGGVEYIDNLYFDLNQAGNGF